jgi:hypothetical protein
MKKLLILALSAIVLNCLTPATAAAQKYQGQVNVGANGAFSLVGLLLTSTFNSIDRIEGLNTAVTPGLNGTIDFGLSDRFSLGVAHFYQSATAKWSSYTDSAGIVQSGDWYYRLTRQNTAVRMLFHFGENDDLDTYFGVRLGYSYWSQRTNVTNAGSVIDLGVFRTRFWPQAVFGARYFFTEYIGANAEIALGFPYYLSVGLNARFGGN